MNHRDTCKQCKASCCKLGGTDFTLGEKQAVIAAGYPDFFVKIDKNHFELRCINGICPYLSKKNDCLIYDIRPLTCKSFPVYIDLENEKISGKYVVLPCPLSKFLSKQEIQEKKQQVALIEDIIKTTFSKSKLPSKDLKIIEKRFKRIKNGKLNTIQDIAK